MIVNPIPQELLDCLEYKSGKLYWKHRQDMPSQWNTRLAGKEAGNIRSAYFSLGFKNKKINKQNTYSCHRIIWLMHNLNHPKVVKTQEGYVFPDIDHEDRNPLNNDKDNLRLTTIKQNQGNAKLAKNNTSGVTGVYRSRNKYKVEIAKKYYGVYDTEEEAKVVAIKVHKEVFGKFSKYWKQK